MHTHGPKGPSVLDEPLHRKEVQNRIAEAERDLPNDLWKTNTGAMAQHWNQSRRQREFKISDKLLNELKPKLSQIDVPQLVDSIKAWPTNGPSQADGVAYWFYVEGNHAILRELKQRQPTELEYLRQFDGDPTFIFESAQGPNPTFGTLCGEVLYERGMDK
jgi:hypothetical protein